MLTSEIKSSIKDSVLCWLATISKDGIPNVSPKEIFTHFGDEHLLIANIASPGSVRNIKANSDVCVSFVDVFEQRGFKLVGHAEIIGKSNPRYSDVHPPLYALAGDDYPMASVVDIKIVSVEPVNAPSYHLFPDRSMEERISDAMSNYGVKPK
jgi:predicted pyridoxine 5'-phosphate oxidase superfamily flavin-nucleotide-binding protein